MGRIDDSERRGLRQGFDLRNAIDDLIAGREVKIAKHQRVRLLDQVGGQSRAVDKEFMAKLSKETVAVEPVDEHGLKALRKNILTNYCS